MYKRQKLDSTSPWGVIDVGSNNQKANYAEAAITINGDLEISNKIQNNNAVSYTHLDVYKRQH